MEQNGNPFDLLRKKRELEEAERLQAEETERIEKEREQNLRIQVLRYFVNLRNQYSEIVRGVFDKLIDAVYTGCEIADNGWSVEEELYFHEISQQSDCDTWRPSWSIVYDTLKTPSEFCPIVVVNIAFDKEHTPTFVCTVNSNPFYDVKTKSKACPLSEAELIKTLIEMHN